MTLEDTALDRELNEVVSMINACRNLMGKPPVTWEDVTISDVRELRHEAAIAGDEECVRVCDDVIGDR